MSLLSFAAHRAIQFYQKKSYDRFLESLSRLELVQREKLSATLEYLRPLLKEKSPGNSYEDFVAAFPVTTYENYRSFFLAEKNSAKKTLPDFVRFQPTSGSTDSVKWIPYTSQLLKDFDNALGPWLYDFYAHSPEILKGPHYWSLSWLPQDLRDQGLRLDDTELFPFWKRILLKKTMAVMAPVDLAGSSESSLFASLAYLLNQKSLSFASVWSPTYWLNLIHLLEKYRTELVSSLESGRWQIFKEDLSQIPCPKSVKRAAILKESCDPKVLWPNLRTISAWNTSTSEVFANKITTRWPHIDIVGKGLWATEACVTIPFQDQYVLAVNSHFFEFQDTQSNEVLPSWQLQLGQQVSPLVTTTGGLIRYKLQDTLKVTKFIGKTPCFEFLGRADGVDMVGEKTSSLRAQEILRQISVKDSESFLFAVKGSPSYYCAALAGEPDDTAAAISTKLESLLAESFHYRLARELGQLGPATARILTKPMDAYVQLHLKRGMVLGNIKVESLRLISEQELKENYVCN